jgi:shikimate dehydrogenase
VLRLALFGRPLAHSRSPQVHAAFGASLGIAVDYRLVEVGAAPGALHGALLRFVAEGGRGANLTLPCKREALASCATLDERAARAGAINTLLVCPDGALHGADTDGAGLLRDLVDHRGIGLAGARVALLGAGGAARSVAAALVDAGVARLQVANRDAARAAALAADLAHPALAAGGYAALEGGRFDLVINATAASLAGEVPPLPAEVLAPGGIAYDLCYSEAPTPFQGWARACGARLALDGWGMLVEQAALSFERWTGRRPPTAALHAARG